MKMPSLSHKLHSHRASSPSYVNVTDSRSAVWTRSSTEDVSLSQLHKFWTGLSSTSRRELLRIDKQALFEQVRKNLYCSRCHGLLVEGFAQIVSYGKNLQAGFPGYSNGPTACSKHLSGNGSNGTNSNVQDDARDPSVHPWGGLAATRDCMLTVLDCFLDGTPLEVFESARARERERELLYPDACGGGGRGWISQSSGGFGGIGRGHGMKETCALHTARLSCEALVDFWSALGEETRQSLLRMKEEDFIERLMFRFDSKRFCRDCRRNVLREFKEMKELKRSRKEPRCTRWFCAADTSVRYEVSDSVVQVDWRDCFSGDVGSVYQRFEWALGTAEGKADILGFKDVGLSESIHVEGLDLGSTAACFVTVRGWKRDGRYSELSAKAHALKGQLCVHRRLIVGDGFVSITKGESIQRFFERAEETEEEEDDDSMDRDGNELDGEGTRPQKHAKSPELARDFLLDAATVIFKEQVEKAFREGTARQNAHSIFVCLALSLLEERVRVACKEITTLEKQNKLLEEEEDEKREEEERRERRKLKEKEKKLRRKEKLRGKERDRDKVKVDSKFPKANSNGQVSGASTFDKESDRSSIGQEDEAQQDDVDSVSARPPSPDMVEARPSADGLSDVNGVVQGLDSSSYAHDIEDALNTRDGNGAFLVERTKSSKRRSQGRLCQIGVISNTNGLSRRGPVKSGGCTRNPARVAPSPAPSLDLTLQDRIVSTLQVHSKNGCRKNEPDAATKRTDSWHRTSNSNIQSRLDDFPQCACGGPQTLRVKGGQRTLIRVGSKDLTNNRFSEKVESGLTPFPKNAYFELNCLQDKGGHRGKLTPTTTKRKGERDQGKAEYEPGEDSKEMHTRVSLCESATGSQNGGYGVGHGQVTPSITNENVGSGKSAWSHNSTVEKCSTVAGRAALVEPAFVNGNGSGLHTAVKTKFSGSVAFGKPVVAGVSSETLTTNVVAVGPSSDQGAVSKAAYRSQASLHGGSGDGSQRHVPGSMCGKISSNMAAESSVSEPVMSTRVRDESRHDSTKVGGVKDADVNGAKFVEQAMPVYAPVVSDSLGPQVSSHTVQPIPVSTGSQANCSLEDLIHGNAPTGFHSPFASKEMSSQASSVPHPIQLPSLVSSHLHLHPQQGFGYYQSHGASWGASRPRNGVLPLPQAGGFFIPAPSGLGLPIGGLPPLSLPQTVPMPTMGLGRIPALPNGLNSLQLRDSIFLSRFGVPSAGLEGRISAIPVAPVSALLESESEPDVQVAGNVVCSVDPVSTPTISVPTVQKDGNGDCSSQTDISGFSLFHYNGPASVSQKEFDPAALIVSLKESTPSDQGADGLFEHCRSGCLDEAGSGINNTCAPAGEYSLFAAAGKGLVFF